MIGSYPPSDTPSVKTTWSLHNIMLLSKMFLILELYVSGQ